MVILLSQQTGYFFQEVGFEKPEQEEALAATPDAGHDLDESVTPCADKPVEVEVASYCHGAHYTNSGWRASTVDSKKRCIMLFLWNGGTPSLPARE